MASLCYWVILQNILLSTNFFKMLISLDPDQAQHVVGPDLGPNCSQRISADDTMKAGRVNSK